MTITRLTDATLGLLLGFLFMTPASTIPIDNNIVEDPVVNCRADSLSIDLKTAKAFGGRVFVKGFSQDSGCSIIGSGETNLDFGVAFNACGLRRTRELNGISVTGTIVVSFHPIFITKVDRAYRLNCFYTEARHTISQQIDVSELTTQNINRQSDMPTCRYEILTDGPEGKPMKYARIGDYVYHRWVCDTEAADVYCMKVHSCSVSDGQGGEQVFVLDEEGCEIDRFVLQNLDYSTDLSAGQGAHVFKFADKPSLHFNCQIELSLKDPVNGCLYNRPQCTFVEPPEINNVNPANYDPQNEQSQISPATSIFTGTGDIFNTPPTHLDGGDETRQLPGVVYHVVGEAGNTTTETPPPSPSPSDFESGYATRSSPAEADVLDFQTEVMPSSKASESIDAAPTPMYQDFPLTAGNAGLGPNEFYADETNETPGRKILKAKQHRVAKRKVADFDLPEQRIVVIEIDEDDTGRNWWDDNQNSKDAQKTRREECMSPGLLVVAFLSATLLGALATICVVRRGRPDELSRLFAHKR